MVTDTFVRNKRSMTRLQHKSPHHQYGQAYNTSAVQVSNLLTYFLSMETTIVAVKYSLKIVVKVCTDSRQNNYNATVLQCKTKNQSFTTKVVFRHFASFSLKTKSLGAYKYPVRQNTAPAANFQYSAHV